MKAYYFSFPGGASGKEPTGDIRVVDSIPGLGRSPGEGNGSPLQYSCLKDPMGRGAWQATVHGVTELDMTEHARSSMHLCPMGN